MKNLLLVVVFAFSSLLFTPTSNAENIAQSICQYVSADDKSRLRSYLKDNKLKIRKIFDNIECNGKNLVAFAGTKNSIKTGSLMIYKLPKGKVKNILTSIKSSELSAIAEKRVNS